MLNKLLMTMFEIFSHITMFEIYSQQFFPVGGRMHSHKKESSACPMIQTWTCIVISIIYINR